MAATEHVRVGVRVRPALEREAKLEGGGQVSWAWEAGTLRSIGIDWANASEAALALLPDDRRTVVEPEHLFTPEMGNAEVYAELGRPLVEGVLEGYNGTVLAYGQTTSGKTHTICGGRGEKGLLQHAVEDLFAEMGALEERFRFKVVVSYCEIYAEVIHDLLDTSRHHLSIVDDPVLGPKVRGISEHEVGSVEGALELLERGGDSRRTGHTGLSEASSRSHAIFALRVESKPVFLTGPSTQSGSPEDGLARDAEAALERWVHDDAKPLAVSTLSVIDLAGSERVSKTKARGVRLREAGHINKSLAALGNVISAINDKSAHIPFRDSKLTRLLAAAFGGNSKTAMICCVAPVLLHHDETRSTLLFAQRASKVQTHAKVNQLETGDAILAAFKVQVTRLQQQLAHNESEKQGLQSRVEQLESRLSTSLASTLQTPRVPRSRRTLPRTAFLPRTTAAAAAMTSPISPTHSGARRHLPPRSAMVSRTRGRASVTFASPTSHRHSQSTQTDTSQGNEASTALVALSDPALVAAKRVTELYGALEAKDARIVQASGFLLAAEGRLRSVLAQGLEATSPRLALEAIQRAERAKCLALQSRALCDEAGRHEGAALTREQQKGLREEIREEIQEEIREEIQKELREEIQKELREELREERQRRAAAEEKAAAKQRDMDHLDDLRQELEGRARRLQTTVEGLELAIADETLRADKLEAQAKEHVATRDAALDQHEALLQRFEEETAQHEIERAELKKALAAAAMEDCPDCEAARADANRLRATAGSLSETIETLEGQLAKAKEDLQEEQDSLAEGRQALQRELETQGSALEATRAELRAVQATKVELASSLAQTQAALAGEREAREQDRQDAAKRLEEALRDAAAAARVKVEEAEREKAEALAEARAQAEGRLEEAQQERRAAAEQLQRAVEKTEAEAEARREGEKALAEAQAKVKQLEVRLQDAQSEVNATKEALSEAEAIRDAAKQSVAKELAEAQDAAKAEQSAAVELEAALSEAEGKIAELAAELSEASSKHEAELREAAEQSVKLEQAQQASERRCEELAGAVARAEAGLAEASARHERALTQAQAEVAALRKENEAHCEALLKRDATGTADRERLLNALESARTEADTMRRQLADARAEAEGAADELLAQRKRAEAEQERLREASRAEADNLQGQLAQARAQLEDAEQAAEERLRAQSEREEAERAEADSLRSELAGAQARAERADELESLLETARADACSLRELLAQKEEDAKQVAARAAQAESERKSQLEAARAEAAALQGQLSNATARADALASDLRAQREQSDGALLKSARAEAEELREQLAAAVDVAKRAADQERLLEASRAEADELRSQLTNAQAQVEGAVQAATAGAEDLRTQRERANAAERALAQLRQQTYEEANAREEGGGTTELKAGDGDTAAIEPSGSSPRPSKAEDLDALQAAEHRAQNLARELQESQALCEKQAKALRAVTDERDQARRELTEQAARKGVAPSREVSELPAQEHKDDEAEGGEGAGQQAREEEGHGGQSFTSPKSPTSPRRLKREVISALRLARTSSKLNNAEAAAARVSNDNAELQEALAVAHKQVVAKERELDCVRAEVHKLAVSKATIQGGLDDSIAMCADLRGRCAELEARCAALEHEQQQRAESGKAEAAEAAEAAETAEVVESLRAQVHLLESKCRRSDKLFESMSKECRTLRAEYQKEAEGQHRDAARSAAQLAAREASLKRCRQELQTAERKVVAEGRMRRALQQRLEILEEQVASRPASASGARESKIENDATPQDAKTPARAAVRLGPVQRALEANTPLAQLRSPASTAGTPVILEQIRQTSALQVAALQEGHEKLRKAFAEKERQLGLVLSLFEETESDFRILLDLVERYNMSTAEHEGRLAQVKANMERLLEWKQQHRRHRRHHRRQRARGDEGIK